MTKITRIPYPRLPLKKYLIIAFIISAVVSFILIFLQPFGTEQFQHPHKKLILLGYGLSVFIATSIFYTLSLKVIHKNKGARWTILMEGMDTFLVVILSLLATYVYSVEIFDRSYNLRHMFYFLSQAATVAAIPTLGCLFFLYLNWKDVIRSSIQIPKVAQGQGKLILVLGNNKTDQVEATSDQIILARAQDNYVMLYLQKAEKIQRHIIRSTLKQVKSQLEEIQFLQVHRSYIVNRSKIVALHGNKSKAQIELLDYEKKVPVSRNVYEEIKSSLKI